MLLAQLDVQWFLWTLPSYLSLSSQSTLLDMGGKQENLEEVGQA